MKSITKTPVKSPCPAQSGSPSGPGKKTGSESSYPGRSESSHGVKEVIYDDGVLRGK